jgi:hypothetical protein
MLQTSVAQNLILTIIEHQQMVIGPLAIDQARKVPGISVNGTSKLSVEIQGTDYLSILSQLVKKYSELFGQTSVEVCREAIKDTPVSVPDKDLPDILRP